MKKEILFGNFFSVFIIMLLSFSQTVFSDTGERQTYHLEQGTVTVFMIGLISDKDNNSFIPRLVIGIDGNIPLIILPSYSHRWDYLSESVRGHIGNYFIFAIFQYNYTFP